MAGLPNPDAAYALFIGVANFDDPIYHSLPGSQAGAIELARLFADPDGIMWRLPAGRVRQLGGDDGRVTVRDAQAALKDAIKMENLEALLVCISCHGCRYPDDGLNPHGLHLAMSDSDSELPGSHLRFDEIRSLLEQAARDQRIRHILLIVDACYADGTKVEQGQGGGDSVEIDHLAVPGVVVLSATMHRVMAWPHWGETPWTAFLGALIDSILAGTRGNKVVLTAKDVFDAASRRLADARRANRKIPVPAIARWGQSDIPLCRNNGFIRPLDAETSVGPGLTAGFTDAASCFLAIQAAHDDSPSRDDEIPGIVASLCGRADVPEGEVARLVRQLETTEYSSYVPHAYAVACSRRLPSDIARLADSLHRNDVPDYERLVAALRGREHAGRVAAEVYQYMVDSPCHECNAAAETISAEIVADPVLAAEALAAWL